ncbi:MATE family efflux transporter [Aquipuribacter nitratireducens]|uniref:MATE family efflux transporter n=1 Tax=Aquipuribacter nitratireducens TaxID=650104 RepID=A0ABW0GNP0_9MICO
MSGTTAGRPGSGSVARREVLALAVPAFGALVVEPLFLLTDTAIVGRLGTDPLAGLGVASAVLSTLVGLFVVLAYGTTATVSRQLGAGRLGPAFTVGVDGCWLALAVGAVTASVGALSAPAVVSAFGVPPGVAAEAVAYLTVSMTGIPAMLFVLAATGVLRGLQDTRTPLVVAVVGFTWNAVLSLVLVHGPGPAPALGIAGSAWGTVVAQTTMAVWLGVLVVRGARRHSAALRPHAAGIATAARAGVPLLLRTVTLRVALLVTVWVAAGTGGTSLAAHQVVFTVWTFGAFALDAIAIAAQALTGRSLGAGDVSAALGATALMVRWGVGGGAVLGGLLAATSPLLPVVFSPVADVRTGITAGLLVVGVTAPLAGYVFVLDGVLIGAGDGSYLARAGVVALLAYLPLVAIVPLLGLRGTTGLVVLWLAFAGGYMAARAVTLGLRARSDRWLVLGAD